MNKDGKIEKFDLSLIIFINAGNKHNFKVIEATIIKSNSFNTFNKIINAFNITVI